MDTFLKSVGVVAVYICFIIVSPVFGVLAGAFVGWAVSVFAPIWVPTGLKFIHIEVGANQLVELGAALGFLGGFFRINLGSKKDK